MTDMMNGRNKSGFINIRIIEREREKKRERGRERERERLQT